MAVEGARIFFTHRPERKMKRVPAEMSRIFSQTSSFENEGRINRGKRGG